MDFFWKVRPQAEKQVISFSADSQFAIAQLGTFLQEGLIASPKIIANSSQSAWLSVTVYFYVDLDSDAE